jgi:hypothetical protein
LVTSWSDFVVRYGVLGAIGLSISAGFWLWVAWMLGAFA